MHKMDKTILLLGDETKALNTNIHSNLSRLENNQSQIATLLTQIMDELGASQPNVNKPVVNLLGEIGRKMDDINQGRDGSEVSGKTSAELINQLSANQSHMMQLMHQMSQELQRINSTETGQSNVVSRGSQSLVGGSQSFVETRNGKGMNAEAQAKNGMVDAEASRSGNGGIANTGSLYNKVSSLGGSAKQALVGLVYRGATAPGNTTIPVQNIAVPVQSTTVNANGAKTVGGGSDKTEISAVHGAANEDGSWTRKIVYFGLVTCVLVLLTTQS
ncbi:uncharacterized protein LOC103504822 isoform X1 [Diaphorina citri]|uniref:Uncharacterized protein LOC103504822 isoform X1 n=1 Tax=Diaphorina citri TaxID=121845 RepID=A0A1S3CUK8_DIACI|nr:uncharacterized protein LOC103504822 isoform X1 [Diaphorina citri]